MSKFEDSKFIILKAFDIASQDNYTPKSPFKNELAFILNENHKTYKYILINALLAKAAMPYINPLCLQKKSKLSGAYDARSHCHEVIVPFERSYLHGALGSSNEPFLNKPARFEELSKDNAVRKGRDKALLDTLCDMLPEVSNSTLAFEALTDSIYYAIQLANNRAVIFEYTNREVSTKQISDFLFTVLEESYGGEILSLAIGSLMKAYVKNLNGTGLVQVHKVNQSGASSKEISDIDVFLNNTILYTIEAKDKVFNEYDVQHAVTKSSTAGASSLFFILGPRGEYKGIEKTPDELIIEAEQVGIHLTLITYKAFINQMLMLTVWNKDTKEFIQFIRETLIEAQIKDEAVSYVLETASNYQLLK